MEIGYGCKVADGGAGHVDHEECPCAGPWQTPASFSSLRRSSPSPTMRPIAAKRTKLKAALIQQHEMDAAKVAAIQAHLASGGEVPPVVAVTMGTRALPLDGHHRMQAAHNLGVEVDAWTITERQFDRLCMQTSDAEAYIICGGIPAMQVADAWARGQ